MILMRLFWNKKEMLCEGIEFSLTGQDGDQMYINLHLERLVVDDVAIGAAP